MEPQASSHVMKNEKPATFSASNATTSTTGEIAGVSLSMRIPPFWRDRPRLWFATFEATVKDQKRSQAQLAQMIIPQLEMQDIDQISDLLYSLPTSGYYEALKDRLISSYEESEGRQLQKLLSDMELGDQKPTQLLRRMRALSHDKVSDATLRLLWLNLMPQHVRSILAVSDTISKHIALDEIALLADKMLEHSHHEISAVTTSLKTQHQPHNPKQDSPRQSDTAYLLEEIKKLSLEISELKIQHNYRRKFQRNHSRTRSHSRSSPHASYRNNNSTSSTYRYYHRRFGEKARRCTTPCTFHKQDHPGN